MTATMEAPALRWTPEQQKEVRTIWVAALRSGEYKQTQSYLRKGDGYCCLGVLCELAFNAGVIPAPEVVSECDCPERHWSYGPEVGMLETGTLPAVVRDWAGLGQQDGQFAGGGGSLANLNDDGISFAEIADIIERDPTLLQAAWDDYRNGKTWRIDGA